MSLATNSDMMTNMTVAWGCGRSESPWKRADTFLAEGNAWPLTDFIRGSEIPVSGKHLETSEFRV